MFAGVQRTSHKIRRAIGNDLIPIWATKHPKNVNFEPISAHKGEIFNFVHDKSKTGLFQNLLRVFFPDNLEYVYSGHGRCRGPIFSTLGRSGGAQFQLDGAVRRSALLAPHDRENRHFFKPDFLNLQEF